MKIFINAGHDIILDPGAVNKIIGINEAEIAKDIALRVEHFLLMVGYEVKSIQSDALSWLINESNTWGADLFLYCRLLCLKLLTKHCHLVQLKQRF